ncbi:MAG: FAD-dependent oxidoreductase, partial [Acidobacteria bacterium]|nr:FAD-dependent oxidoreductase [Acidobacteriota bacterium]
ARRSTTASIRRMSPPPCPNPRAADPAAAATESADGTGDAAETAAPADDSALRKRDCRILSVTVLLEDGTEIPASLVIMAVGIRPATQLAVEAGLEIGPTRAIAVNEQMQTSDPDIFAVGDCAEHPHLVTGTPVWMPGAAAATIQGRAAAVNICGGSDEYPGTAGTIIIKLFDATIARTGLTSAQARESGFDPVRAIVSGPDRAHFVPHAETILLAVIADRATRRLLGAQGFGAGEVAKRIDVIATAIGLGASVDALAHLSLSYAPPYAMAMDVEIAAANVLRNKLDGRFVGISPSALRESLVAQEPIELLDVRLPSEFNVVRLRGSKHVPLGALRSRLHEVPRERPIVLVCKVGLRSYEASLILRAHGFEDVRVLDGGLDGWPYGLERLT